MCSLAPRICQLATVASAIAAGLPHLRGDPVVHSEPVIVAETPLSADATGTSQLRMTPATPVDRTSFAAAAESIANLHMDASGAGSFGSLVALRGVSNTPYFSDASVAVYFDDLPLGSAFTFPTDLFGFTTVTVARGPQPAATGRNAEAGVITLSSPRPGPVGTGELIGGIGNYDARTTALTAASARGAAADATVSATYTTRAGYISNPQLGRRVDDQQVATAAARLRIRPTAASEITFQVLADRHRDGAQPLVPIGGPLFTVSRGREGATDSDFAGGALKVAFDTAIGRLSATTSRTWWRLDPYDNRLVLPPPLDSHLAQRQAAWNEELRLASAADAGLPWSIGAWFSDNDTSGAVNRAIPGLFPIEGSSFTLASHTVAVFGQATIPMGGGTLLGEPSRSSAADWRLIAAVRLEHTAKDFARTQTVPAPAHFAGAKHFDAVLPKLTVIYAIDSTANASLAVGVGARPGGWSAYTDNPHLAGFRAEKLASVEAGVDKRVGHAVTFAARVFGYEIRDYQIERSFNATDYLVVNAPRARALGAELETGWHPVAGLTLTATAGVTDITLRDFTDPFTGTSYAGKRAPYAPEYDVHGAAVYRFAGGWFAQVEGTAVGKTFFEESNTVFSASRAHATANAAVGYDARRWRVALHAENLANAAYTTLVIPGVGHEVPGAPRTYGLEAAVKW